MELTQQELNAKIKALLKQMKRFTQLNKEDIPIIVNALEHYIEITEEEL